MYYLNIFLLVSYQEHLQPVVGLGQTMKNKKTVRLWSFCIESENCAKQTAVRDATLGQGCYSWSGLGRRPIHPNGDTHTQLRSKWSDPRNAVKEQISYQFLQFFMQCDSHDTQTSLVFSDKRSEERFANDIPQLQRSHHR